MSLKIAVVGDQFIGAERLESAARSALRQPFDVVSRDLPWPEVPFFDRSGPAGAEIAEYSGDPREMEGLLVDADVLLTHLAPVTRDLIGMSSKLRFIGVTRGGPTNINMEAAKERRIAVANVPGRNASAVAEFTVGAILAQTRLITLGHVAMASGDWRGDLYRYDRTGDELCDLTVGIVGYSHVGQRVTRLLKPFGCKILICDPYVTLRSDDAADGVEQVDIDTLIRRADVVTLHARVTREATGLISAARLAAMKRGAILINTARGPLVDQAALVQHLKSGHLGGAALDTFIQEPPAVTDELLKLPNVTLTPHIAGASRRVATYAVETLVADLARFLDGGTIVNPAYDLVLANA